MTTYITPVKATFPAWLPLLQKPYDNLLGSRPIWDLRMDDGTAVRIERANQGLNNALYRVRVGGEVYACKFFVKDERRRGDREWAAVNMLQSAGRRLAPEPVALANDGPLPQPVIIYRWVNSVTLAGQSLSRQDLIQLIGALNEVHRTPSSGNETLLPAWHQPSSYQAYYEEVVGFYTRLRAWADEVGVPNADLPQWLAGLRNLLPLMEQTAGRAKDIVGQAGTDGVYHGTTLVRVDGNLENIVRDENGQIVFMDWECSGLGDPAFDLAEQRWHPRTLNISQQEWEAAMAAYLPAGDDPGFAERLAVYSQLVPAWWVGRSVLHLLEAAGAGRTRRRLAPIPGRMYRSVRKQLDRYLVALKLMDMAEATETDDE